MTIAPATTADAPIMAAVHAAAFPPGDAWSADVFYLQTVLPGVHGLLHGEEGMILFRIVADEAEILTLAVVPAARRHGVASALLTATFDALHQAGAVALFLEVSLMNEPARALYVRVGFEEVGRRRRYYADGTDALVLRRRLG